MANPFPSTGTGRISGQFIAYPPAEANAEPPEEAPLFPGKAGCS